MSDILTIEPTNSAGLQKALNTVGSEQHYLSLELQPGVYVIDKPLFANTGTDLYGPKSAVFQLIQNAPKTVFPGDPDGARAPIIGQRDGQMSDIKIHGFTFDGQESYQSSVWGKGYHDFCYLVGCSGFEMYDMTLTHWQGDGARLKGSQGIYVHDNLFLYSGHDTLHCRDCSDVDYYNNVAQLRTNSGGRVINTNHVKFHDNWISGSDNWWAGGPGFQIDHSDDSIMDDIEIYNNAICRTYGPGIWIDNFGSFSSDLNACRGYYIHDNLITGCGLNPTIDWTAGILWSGVDDTVIEHNTVIGNYRYGVACHVGSSVWGTKPQGRGYELNVRKNIIANTLPGRYNNGIKNGYGIANTLFVTHSVYAEDNVVFGNAGGSELNMKSSTDSFEAIDLDNMFYPLDTGIGVDWGRRMI